MVLTGCPGWRWSAVLLLAGLAALRPRPAVALLLTAAAVRVALLGLDLVQTQHQTATSLSLRSLVLMIRTRNVYINENIKIHNTHPDRISKAMAIIGKIF